MEPLGVWQSPIDNIALKHAELLGTRQPQCSIMFNTDFELMTLYNYGSFVGNYGLGAPANSAALTAMFSAMSTGQTGGGSGGMAFIPQYSFPVEVVGGGFTVPDQCDIRGSGGGGTGSGSPPPPDFYHFVVTPNPLFPSIFLNCAGPHTSGGKYFRSLAFKWGTTTQVTDTCIYAGTWNCRAVSCVFVNCPTAFNAAELSSGLDQCTIEYNSGPNGAVAVFLQMPQTFACGPCEFFQTALDQAGAPTGCTAISLGNGIAGKGPTEHALIQSLHLANWSYAINYSIYPGVYGTEVSCVEADAWVTAVRMVPPQSTGKIYGEKYVTSHFRKSGHSMDGSPIMLIDTDGGANDNVSDISFNACTVIADTEYPQPNQYGYQINQGSNIEIIGGTVSNMGPNGGANIAITGPCSRVNIIGVNLRPTYANTQNASSPSQYALLISGSPTDPILVQRCFMDGFTTPVLVTGNPASLYINDCPGYNDQNTRINATAPTSSHQSASNQGTSGGTNYYGPSLLIFTNGGVPLSFTVNSVTSTVPPNAFVTVYVASPYDTIQFSAQPAHFAWLGK